MLTTAGVDRSTASTIQARARRLPRRSTPSAALLAAFAVTLTVALAQGPKPFYYDSGNYWSLGATFVSHGHFSLTNFDSPLRGYILPLIDHGLAGLAAALAWSDSSLVKLFNVLLVSLIGAVLVPRLAEVAWPRRRWGMPRRLALTALLLAFWSGYLNFPLSDLPAFALALLAILAASRPYPPWRMLLVGALTAATIDVRPSYSPLVPIVLVLAGWELLAGREQGRLGERGRRALTATLCAGLAVAGFAIVSLPQSLSAHRHFGTYSFVPGSADGLEYLQLTEGMRLQRYDTFVGPTYRPQMNYTDQAGSALLLEQPSEQIGSVPQYLELVVDHPVTFAGIFARHVVNGLDVRYSTPYTEHVATDWWLRIGGFTLIFAALLRVVWPRARRSLGPASWRYPVALLTCGLTAVPSAIETRYMLPVFAVGYMLALAPGWPSPVAASGGVLRRHRLAAGILAAYLISAAIVWHVTSETSHSLELQSAGVGAPDVA